MDYHRIFGLILDDFFTHSPYEVILEEDLSLKQQLLDVVIIRRREGLFSRQLPDGMTDLVDYNLISFKSHQDTFDVWALEELMSHFVSYRKKVSPSFQELIPEVKFKLFAVAARFPSQLALRVELNKVQEGVYDLVLPLQPVRLIVMGQLQFEEQNAMMQLFSAKDSQFRYGCEHFQQQNSETSTLLQTLLNKYKTEGIPMPYTFEQFRQEARKDFVESLSEQEMKEIIKKGSTKDRLEGLAPKDRVEGLAPKDRLEGVAPEEVLRVIPPEDLLKSLSPQEIDNLFNKLREKSRDS